MFPKYELLNYQDKLFYVYRKLLSHHIKEGGINELKDYWLCDTVLKNTQNNNNYLWFLREIPEAEIVED